MKGRAQWRIQGRGRGDRPPPPPHTKPHLLLDQTEARKAEKKFFNTALPYLMVWMTNPPPPPLSEGLDPPLACACVVRAS